MPHAAAGADGQQLKIDGVFRLAANDAAGQDALRGFKSRYNRKIVGEICPAAGQLDHAAEPADRRRPCPTPSMPSLPAARA
jgi:hypothetical protein